MANLTKLVAILLPVVICGSIANASSHKNEQESFGDIIGSILDSNQNQEQSQEFEEKQDKELNPLDTLDQVINLKLEKEMRLIEEAFKPDSSLTSIFSDDPEKDMIDNMVNRTDSIIIEEDLKILYEFKRQMRARLKSRIKEHISTSVQQSSEN